MEMTVSYPSFSKFRRIRCLAPQQQPCKSMEALIQRHRAKDSCRVCVLELSLAAVRYIRPGTLQCDIQPGNSVEGFHLVPLVSARRPE
jgi:hypothetical protein